MSLAGRGGDESRPDSCSPVPLSTEWCSWPHGAVLSTRATPRRQPDLSDGHPSETCQSHSTVTGFPVFLLCTSDYQPLEVRPPVSTCRDGEDRRPRCLSYKQWNSSGRALASEQRAARQGFSHSEDRPQPRERWGLSGLPSELPKEHFGKAPNLASPCGRISL